MKILIVIKSLIWRMLMIRNIEKLEVLLFEESNRDYYKPKVIDRGFAGEVNNYIKYISEGIKMKNYHPENILI